MPASKPQQCNKGCGQMLYFDRTDPLGMSQSGKPVPLEWDDGPSGNPHNCPKSDYNQQRRGGPNMTTVQQPTRPTNTESSAADAMTTQEKQMFIANQLDALGKIELIISRLEALQQLAYGTDKKVTKLLENEIGNPLDDDGDSQRENPEREDNL